MKLKRAIVFVAIIVLVIPIFLFLRIVNSNQNLPSLNNVPPIGWEQIRQHAVLDQEVGKVAETELDGMEVTEIALSETELDDSAKNQVEQTRTPRQFNPDVDLTVLRDTSFGEAG